MVLLLRSLAGAAVVVLVATVALLPSPAHAQSKSSQGTSMSLTPAAGGEAFGCETRWQPGFAPPFEYERQPTGMTTCTAYQPGTTVDNTHLVPGPGYVTKVRVRSGANPAPLRITIMKRLFQTNPATGEITDATCCTGTGSESATFQPPPNTVHELTLNPPLKVTTSPSQNGASGHHDIVAVSAMGPGDLPIASTGPHTLSEFSAPAMQMFYPKVETGLQGQAQHDYVNYLVLMNYDWTACPSSGAATASQACPSPDGGGGGGGGGGGVGGADTGTTAAPVSFKSKALRLKKGKVRLRLACTSATGTTCKGKARLRTRAKKPKTLATKSLAIPGGKTRTVTFKLSNKARKVVRKKKSTNVTLQVDLGAGGKATKNLKLKR
jgi:hypothetical protein